MGNRPLIFDDRALAVSWSGGSSGCIIRPWGCSIVSRDARLFIGMALDWLRHHTNVKPRMSLLSILCIYRPRQYCTKYSIPIQYIRTKPFYSIAEIQGQTMASSSTALPLSDPIRHITDNDENGTSFFSKALPMEVPVVNDLGGAHQRLGYCLPQTPGLLTDQADIKAYQADLQDLPALVPVNGTTAVWYIDMPPGSASPVHRTVSLDVVIQVIGEVELTLDSGETRIIRPGDVTIQRSTSHAWRNTSTTEWSRMIGIMGKCHPVQIGDKTLGDEFRTDASDQPGP